MTWTRSILIILIVFQSIAAFCDGFVPENQDDNTTKSLDTGAPPAPTPPADAPQASPTKSTGGSADSGDCQTAWQKVTGGANGTQSSSCNMDNPNSDTSQLMTLSRVFLAGMSQNPLTACSQMNTLASTASLAITVFQNSCSGDIQNCISSCESSESSVNINVSLTSATGGGSSVAVATQAAGASSASTNRSHLRDCQSYQKNLPNQTLAVMQWLSQNQQAQQACAALQAQLAQQQAAECAADPSLPVCANSMAATDCTNPANTSAICTCYHNPGACQNGALSSGGAAAGGLSGGAVGGASSLASGAGVGGMPGGLEASGDPLAIGQGTPASNQAAIVPGAGGGGGLGGGNAAALPASKAAGRFDPNAASRDAKVYGGSLGGGAGGAGQSASAGSGYANANNAQKGVFGGKLAVLPNLKLPTVDRALASVGGGGVDGITGPNTDLWLKVNAQYSTQASKGNFIGK